MEVHTLAPEAADFAVVDDIDSVEPNACEVTPATRFVAIAASVSALEPVIYLSADTLADEKKSLQTGPTDIYIVRVKLNSVETKAIPGFSPTPGMPAEVYIKTADRTFFQYIVKPIQDSMSRAFRER